jgi:hypothetical protein
MPCRADLFDVLSQQQLQKARSSRSARHATNLGPLPGNGAIRTAEDGETARRRRATSAIGTVHGGIAFKFRHTNAVSGHACIEIPRCGRAKRTDQAHREVGRCWRRVERGPAHPRFSRSVFSSLETRSTQILWRSVGARIPAPWRRGHRRGESGHNFQGNKRGHGARERGAPNTR